MNGILSREFCIRRGVRQGDPISPTLFNAALEAIMQVCKAKWQVQGYGVDVADTLGENLTNLRFADDVTLFASSLRELRLMLEDVVQEARYFGLHLHPDKTKVLSNYKVRKGRQASQFVNVLDMRVEILAFGSFTKYLGRRLGFSSYHETEIIQRLNCAWKKFHLYKGLLTNAKIPTKRRLELFDQTITPTVLYGSCAWTMKVEFEQKLRKTQRQMLRIILHKRRVRTAAESSSDSSSSSTTDADDDGLEAWVDWIRRVTAEVEHEREKCGIKSWESQQRLRKLRWAGHVARMSVHRWASVLLFWQPTVAIQAQRKRGHPCKRWVDDLEALGDWTEMALDRERWKSVCIF